MNAKHGLWMMVAILSIVMACNYTEGDCYPVGQADGPAAADVGAGVGSGAGGFGDMPPGGGTGANACNASDEPTPPDKGGQEEGLKVFCFKKDWGAICSDRCFAKGVPCVGGAVQPYKSAVAPGKLFSCNDLWLGFMCGYHYDNGDDCYYPFGRPGSPLCSYSGDGQN